MEKGRANRDVIIDERCNKMREQKDKKRQKKNQQTVEPSSSYEQEHRSQITKNRS